jgi:putative transposase
MSKQKKASQMPSAELVAEELGKAKSIDDFFGKKGIFSRLFSKTMETMMEEELTQSLGYSPYELSGRNSGNSRNGSYSKKIRTSSGDCQISVPRDRNGEFKPEILKKYSTSSNELEDKIVSMYARGMSTRDIQNILEETYGVDISPATISAITEKVQKLAIGWQSRPLEAVYPIVFLDAIHVRMKVDDKIQNVAVYCILGITLSGHREILGHWISTGGEGSNYWLNVVTDLKNRGVEDIFIACIDGLKGFKEAIQSVFLDTEIQRCIIHQIRNSLKYVSWKDKKKFMKDMKTVYRASTKEEAEMNLLKLSETWGTQYAIAVRSWEDNWDDLSTYFGYTPEIRRMIYTTNTVEGYHRQLRKVIKTKSTFPTSGSVQKILYLIMRNVSKKWNKPMAHWPSILNQLAIKFENRMTL